MFASQRLRAVGHDWQPLALSPNTHTPTAKRRVGGRGEERGRKGSEGTSARGSPLRPMVKSLSEFYCHLNNWFSARICQ